MNKTISRIIFAALDEANRPRRAARNDNWEHPDAWKVDRDFNRSFLAVVALAILTATAGAFFSPKATATHGHNGRAAIGEYCGVSAAEYAAGNGDDTNY